MSQSKKSALHKKDDDARDLISDEAVPRSSQLPTRQSNIDEEGQSFDIVPIKKKCTYCNVEVVTYVEHEGHPMFMIFALICILIFGFLSVIILPVAYLVTKNAVHRCSRCLQKMGEKQCFGIPTNFQDEIWQFRLGKCAVVVSRGYALALLVVFTILSLYYVYMRPSLFLQQMSPYETPKESKHISATWEDFLKDCGGEVVVENFVHARSVFNKKYEANIVTWDGYFVETKKPSGQVPWFGSDHALNVLVKMMPSESALYPDLVLSIPSSLLQQKKNIIEGLSRGDEIRFQAKIMTLGNEFKMHHLHAINVDSTGLKKELNEIIVRESTLP